jgi:hypothetical protein
MCPNMVRVLAGDTRVNSLTETINQGEIFKCLVKP